MGRGLNLPVDLAQRLTGYHCHQITWGKSAAVVYRLTQQYAPTLYLKSAPNHPITDLYGEKQRLEWLADLLPVPQVYYYSQEQERTYLLLSEIPGINASDRVYQNEIPQLVKLLAQGLSLIHRLPIKDCPFDHTLDAEIARASYRTKQGLVDESDFDDERLGRSAKELFTELLADRPASIDLAFTHGDYCLPNVIIHEGHLSGFVDLGAAGVGDRYRDLALAARSLAWNFGQECVPLLFQEYGINQPDLEKLEYYELLDQFF